MKKSILILGFALAAPIALLAQGPRKGGPGGPPHGPGGPGGPDGGPGEVHDDPHRNPMFHALLRAIDTDGDGIISMSEMNHAAESLLALDKNGDGKLTPNELMPRGHDHRDGPPPPPPPKGDKGDKGDKPEKPDKDGNPKPAVDKDGNPLPDGDKGDDQKPRKGHKPPGDGDNGQNNPPPPREDEQRSALVDAIDTNHDGIISADEIAAARANLKKLDLNHDGKLEPHEYGRPHHKD